MILVTGATGHIGSHLVQALVAKGERVRAMVRNENVRLPKVEMAYGDILDAGAVERATQGADVIYHLAAVVDYLPAPKDLTYKANVIGTKNMLEHSNARRFIYQSSTAVYGRNMKENPARETTPFNPHSYYGQTKVMAEKLVLEHNGIVLRSPVIFGPGFNEGFEYVLRHIEKGRMSIVGSGQNLIHWIHINDLVQALLLAKDRGKLGEVYLVAGKEIKTQQELFGLLAKYLRVEPPTKKVPRAMANALAYYKMIAAKMKGKKPSLVPEDVSKMSVSRSFDISKARKELGFEPRVSYDEAAKEIVEEYLKKKAG